MLTKADDYPIHQTPEPIAYSGTDRNFYDRYFFNGYTPDGSLFFAGALGVYPHLNVMDASFCIVAQGRQYNVHASKTLHMERLDTRVGPIEVEVIEPLAVLRLAVNDPDNGIHADLTFSSRSVPIEEPRFMRRVGSQTMMDYTRLTQNGTWNGTLEFNGEAHAIDASTVGTRDRSWGIRGVGMRDPQPNPYASQPQFFWLWAPLNIGAKSVFYHLNADEHGRPWNTEGRIADADTAMTSSAATSELTFRSGSRHAATAQLHLPINGERTSLTLKPTTTFYMKGLGYGHPEWSHGLYHGELETGFEVYELDQMSDADPTNFHIQALVDVTMEGAHSGTGKGVLEQLVIGPYEPYGFSDLMDVAP
jgi:hypothetical protein